MNIAFVMLGCVVVSIISDLVYPLPGLLGWRLLTIGLGLLISQFELDESEARHIQRGLAPVMIAWAVPAIWIVVQLLPLPIWGNQVWDSAGQALGRPLAASISVDLTASFNGFGLIMLMSAITVLTAIVSIDRVRAQQNFVMLTCLIVIGSCYAGFFAQHSSLQDRSVLAVMAALGAMLSLGCGVLAYERFSTRHAHRRFGRAILALLEVACVCGIVGCWSILVVFASRTTLWAAGVGTATTLVIVFVRRLSFGVSAGIALAMLFSVASLIALEPVFGPPAATPDTQSSPSIDAITRLGHDTPLTGFGVASYAAISRLYGTQASSEPTDAYRLRAELGTPVFWITTSLAILVGLRFIAQAFGRGRDSIYATAGASGVLAIIALGFAGPGLFHPAVGCTFASLLGLACAQGKGRSAS